MKHALIIGEPHSGKTTLIHKITQTLACTVTGFETKKENRFANEANGSPIYIYRVGEPHGQSEENLLGYSKMQHLSVDESAFDRAAQWVFADDPTADLIVMDEIGVMESCSEAFCREIIRCLDGERPVLAAVKSKDSPFLSAVRAHPNCRCFYLTEENRDAIYPQVLAFVREQFGQLSDINSEDF